jgi:gas vesicle protein
MFLVGAAVGASVALLYAPMEGEKTRRAIGDKANEVKGRATDISHTVRDRAADFTSTVTQTAKEKMGQVQDKTSDLLRRTRTATAEADDNAAENTHSTAEA